MATRALKTVENIIDELPQGPHVYRAIAAVQGELAMVGIAKTRRNTQGSGYNFRGIDDVYAALSPLLAKHKLVVVPRVTQREVIERQSRQGGALFYVTVHVEFDFVSAIDGTTHTAATYGEAMDSGDKATNKAMSAAYKYAAFMTFAIPTEGDNDTENVTHEVAARPSTGEPRRRESVALDGPYNTVPKLEAAAKQFVRTLRSIETIEDFDEWRRTDEVKEFVAQCKRDLSGWWSQGPTTPADFVPLEIEIAQTKRGLEELKEMENN